MANVLVEEQSLQDVADAIREKNGTEAIYKPSEMGDAIRLLRDKNVDYVDYFDFRNYKFEKLHVESTSASCYCAQNIHNTQVGFLKDNAFVKECIAIFPNAKYGRFAFSGCPNIIYIKIDVSNIKDEGQYTAYNNTFSNCPKLETIDALIDGSNCSFIDSTFTGCNNLKNVRFVPLSIKSSISFANSSLLSDESIQSIIDGLSDVTGEQEKKTLSLHSYIIEKLTVEQWSQLDVKNWRLG